MNATRMKTFSTEALFNILEMRIYIICCYRNYIFEVLT